MCGTEHEGQYEPLEILQKKATGIIRGREDATYRRLALAEKIEERHDNNLQMG